MKEKRALMLFLLTLSAGLHATEPVNTTTSHAQRLPDMMVNDQGIGLLTWTSYDQDGSSNGIVGRWIDSNGLLLTPEQILNTGTQGNQTEPSVAVNDQGIALIAWQGPWNNLDDQNIIGCLVLNDGSLLTSDVLISTQNTGDQILPMVCASDQHFCILWEDKEYNNAKQTINARYVTPSGEGIKAQQSISDTPKYACRFPSAAMDTEGRMVAVWLEDRTTNAIRARRFDSDGSPLGASFQINAEPFKSVTCPSVALFQDGGFVVTWDGDPNLASQDAVRVRWFAPNNTPLSDEVVVHANPQAPQRNPVVSTNTNGSCIIAWESLESDSDLKTDIWKQCFTPDMHPIGSPGLLNTEVADDQDEVRIFLNANHQFLAVWTSDNHDGSDKGIFMMTGSCDIP